MLVNADEFVTGWKVAKELPSWVNNYVAWEGFVIDIKDHTAGSEGLPSPEESISDNMSSNSEGSGMEGCVVANMDDSDDVGEEEKAYHDKEEENDEEDEEQDVNEVDKAKDEEEEEQEDSKVGEETDENEEHMSSDIDDTDEESDASVSTNIHQKAKKQSSNNTLKYAKKSAHNKGNVEDVMFKNLFSGDSKLKVAENVNKSPKTNSIGVYITGPFCNNKTHKSHWVVVYGDNGIAWMLKSEFICGYLSAVLPGHRKGIIDINHCHTYEDIHICKDEFGSESVWRCRSSTTRQKNMTNPRISYVYSCDTTNEKIGKQGISEAVKIFIMSMEKRDLNPIGPMVLEHLKNHVDGLYRYFMKDKIDKEPVGEPLTEDIHKHFHGGYNLIWGDWLNLCMVDYDIICVLKDYVGYTNWSDVPIKQRELCNQYYNNKSILPEWNVQGEKF